jgi:hypothetical protein
MRHLITSTQLSEDNSVLEILDEMWPWGQQLVIESEIQDEMIPCEQQLVGEEEYMAFVNNIGDPSDVFAVDPVLEFHNSNPDDQILLNAVEEASEKERFMLDDSTDQELAKAADRASKEWEHQKRAIKRKMARNKEIAKKRLDRARQKRERELWGSEEFPIEIVFID